MTNPDHDLIWQTYVLEHEGTDDEALRAVLRQTCPKAESDWQRAEMELAQLGIALPAVAPSPGLKQRVLQRIAQDLTNPRARSPTPKTSAPSLQGPTSNGPYSGSNIFRRPTRVSLLRSGPTRYPLAALSLMLVVVLTILFVRLERRNDLTDQRLQAVLANQQASTKSMDDVIDRLRRTRTLADALRERENRLAVMDRRYRDLELVAVSDKGMDVKELTNLREEMDILSSPNLAVIPLQSEVHPTASLRLFWDKTTHRWMVTGTNLPSLDHDRCYEVWMKTTDGRFLASETFVPDESGRVRVMMDVPTNVEMSAIVITDEPMGGVSEATGAIRFLANFQ